MLVNFKNLIAMKRIVFLSSVLLGLVQLSFAQSSYVNKEWESTNYQQQVTSIERTVSKLDYHKNLITLSNSYNSSTGSVDVFLKKVDRAGNTLWVRHFNGASNLEDIGIDFTFDSNQNIIVIANIGTQSGIDIGLIKYSRNGNLLWDKTWNSQYDEDDIPLKVEVDNNDNIYVAGGTENTQAFSDYVILKYKSTGQIKWKKFYDFTGLHDIATGLKILSNGGVIVSGASASSTNSWDFATLRLDSLGGYEDTIRTVIPGVGLDRVEGVETDANNNVYVYGTSGTVGNRDVQIVKFNSSFQFDWVTTFNTGDDDVARSLDIDNNGNLYLLETTLESNGSQFTIVKYDDSGNTVWKRNYNAGSITKRADGVMLQVDNNYVTVIGNYKENSNENFVTLRYSLDGDIRFETRYDSGSDVEKAKSLSVDGNDVYVNGVVINGSLITNKTIKYNFINKEDVVVYANGKPSHIKNELIIRFDPAVINTSIVDDVEYQTGPLSRFVNQSVLVELNQRTHKDWRNYRTYKVFRRLTTGTSISISRLGDLVGIPKYWSTLLVEIPDESPLNVQMAPQSTDPLDGIIQSISNGSSVRYAEKNMVGTFSNVPDDYYYYGNAQSGLKDNAYGINVEGAWAKEVGNPSVRVGIFDHIVNWRHEDLGDGTWDGSKIAGGWSYSQHIPASSFTDFDNHGTACAGIIGAKRNNTIGVAGIAGGDVTEGNTGAKLFTMGISKNGTIAITTSSNVADAILEGAIHSPSSEYGYGLHIQNHSWAGTNYSKIVREAILTCFKNHCAFVNASGNTYYQELTYPSGYNKEWAMKVGANDISGARADFSTYGHDLDFIAPGTSSIYKTLKGTEDDGYYSEHGTSFAAPHVSGVSALLFSHHRPLNHSMYPNMLGPEDVEHILQETATDVDLNPPTTTGYDVGTGYGRINANEAVKKVSLPYRVHHFDINVIGSGNLTLVNSNQNISYPDGLPTYNYPSNYTYGTTDVYEFTKTVSHSIPSTQSYVDGWIRNSSCNLYEFNTSEIENPQGAGMRMVSSNQNSATFKGYVYKVEVFNEFGTSLGYKWAPYGGNNNIKIGYSIHTLDQNPSVNVEEIEIDNDINVYPNPTLNSATITISECYSGIQRLELIESTGKVLDINWEHLSNENGCSTKIDLSSVNTGVYFVKLTIDDKVVYQKVIKQ